MFRAVTNVWVELDQPALMYRPSRPNPAPHLLRDLHNEHHNQSRSDPKESLSDHRGHACKNSADGAHVLDRFYAVLQEVMQSWQAVQDNSAADEKHSDGTCDGKPSHEIGRPFEEQIPEGAFQLCGPTLSVD